MGSVPIELGAVYEYSSSWIVRIIAFDAEVVMYDIWAPHKQRWTLSTLGANISYLRTDRVYFEANSRFLRLDPLSEQELEVHCPQLPFAFAKNEGLSWYDDWLLADISFGEQTLCVPAVYLEPFGPKDSTKPSVLVHAENGEFFTEKELLALASEVLRPHLGEKRLTNGVGIYRAGIRKRTPSYYLWGDKSRMETGPAKVY